MTSILIVLDEFQEISHKYATSDPDLVTDNENLAEASAFRFHRSLQILRDKFDVDRVDLIVALADKMGSETYFELKMEDLLSAPVFPGL